MHYFKAVPKYVSKWSSTPEVQMKSQFVDSKDLICIAGFLYAVTIACDKNVVHEVTAVWLVLFLIKTGAAAFTETFFSESRLSR